MKKNTVLVVDDELLSVEILCNLLEDEYDIIKASGGAEALKIIYQTTPDIILLDLLMPDVDGYEVYRNIRRIPALDGTPVLFITALANTQCESAGLEMGANDYIHKPFNAGLVRLRIKNLLALSQQRSLLLQRSEELYLLNKKLAEEISQKVAIQKANEELIRKLEETLAQVKRLEGIIPICSYCHKIRDDNDGWRRLEQYLVDHSEAQLSHGVCPECYAKQMTLLKS